MAFLRFPEDFEWGVATAAAQIEGAAKEDGKGESVWDRFSARPGAIEGGDSPAVACDHYHRYPEDVELMRGLGIKHYRLSLSWPRILPEGRGRINRPGIDFYRRLLTALRGAGIRPAVTLFHWDTPQALQDGGGWMERSTADAFAEYARVCFGELGDLVDRWITLNEPQVVVMAGHEVGNHAPGIKDPGHSLQVAHHLLLGHGLATKAYRQAGGKGQVGISLNMSDILPATPDPKDRMAADMVHLGGTRWYADPIILGGYPELAARGYKAQGRFPEVRPGDMDIIRQPLDFLGINYYFPMWASSAPVPGNPDALSVVHRKDLPVTEMDWNVDPQGLYRLLKRLTIEYPGLPLMVTENGAAYRDALVSGLDGKKSVHDRERVEYLKGHFATAHRLIAEGVPLKAYYVWSLMDNFEWAAGYAKRFGVVYVDYASQERTVKDSGLFLAATIRDGGFEA
jgi:beta-glucosidase